MGSRRFAAVVLVFQSLLAGAAIYAADSADCTGSVLDENGVPVPAAQVKFDDASGHSYRAETDGAGHFVLRGLPPGEYKAEVRKQGFFVLAGQALTLHPGANELSLILNHEQELREKVQVTAPSNQIDTQDTSQRSSISAKDIRDVPVPNTHILRDSLITLPEVVQDNRVNLHVAGARSGDTQYLLDGFEIGDPVSGALTSRLNVDATRAAEIQTGRFGAAYAHSGASILSLETPDGDDRWRFGTTNPAPGINVQEGVHLGNWYPRFTFSGPIERGRFWFSNSISVQHTFAVVKQLPSGANTSEEWAGDNLLRLQYNFSPRHILHASFLYNRARDTNLGLDALDPQSTTVTADQRRAFVSLKDQIWLYETLVELGIAADGGVLDYTPQGSQPFVLLINGTTGNYFQHLRQRGRRLQAVVNVIAASRHWHGTHQLAVGGNAAGLLFHQSAQRGEIDALNANSSAGAPCALPTDPGCLVRRSTFMGGATPQISNTQLGAYAQDTWAISRHFVFQAGVRTDWDRFTQSAMLGPRVSANVLPFGDDHSKISLGWGIYNAPLNLALIGQVLDQQQIDTFYNPAGAVIPPSPVTSQFVLPASGLHQPRFTITSAGWQQKFGRNTLAGVELLARNGYHGFAFVDQQPVQPGGIFLLEDHRKDRYRSATISARHVFSESTELFGAYTRSLAHSNEVLNTALGSIFYAAQQSAPLAWDAPNRFLSWGWTPTHIWSTQLSYFLEYRTGYPFSVVNLQQQLVGLPNSLRFPAYASLNLGLERKFGFRGYLWALRVEAVNILGRQNPDVVVNNVDAPACTSALTTGCFGAFSGGQGRAFTLRARFVGRK
ncbi:MAG TPA: carboxypeptidase regulatory-like domain-containing protein [Candidatus Angelobacter sp.]|nr:carboxypeptidase regulatory-like domain-containing protein [Candidatus Angelobacter sp.]